MTSSDQSRPGFWRRLGRAFLNFFKLIFWLAFVAAVATGVWFSYQAWRQAETNQQWMDLLREDVDGMMVDASGREQRLSALEDETGALAGQIESLETDLTADLARQEEALAMLEGQIDGLGTASGIFTETVGTLESGVMALQRDVVSNTVSIDQLGGMVDGLAAQVTVLDESVASLQEEVTTPAGEVVQLQRALTLFRVWEMVSRARLHLAEGNAGTAQTDVDMALAALTAAIADAPDAEVEALRAAQQRLVLARASLPNDPVSATRDLEEAWEALDGVLAMLLGVEAAPAPAGGISPTPPITATETITP